jgi:hypothetical protein
MNTGENPMEIEHFLQKHNYFKILNHNDKLERLLLKPDKQIVSTVSTKERKL